MQKLFYFTFLVLLSFACHSQQNIGKDRPELVKIIYSNYGGQLGWQESLILTQDSVNYNSFIARTKETYKFQDTISTDSWRKLASSFDLKTFKSIRNGPSRLPIDGTDTRYTVILNSGKEYSFVNGKNFRENKKMNLFFEWIDSIKTTMNTTRK